RRLVLMGYGSLERLQIENRPLKEPRQGEIRIKVENSGINFADMMARQGIYRINPKPPCVLGYEVSGIVESHGIGVTQPAIGTRVIGFCNNFGGWSEYALVPADLVFAMPENMSYEEGAALLVNYLTAYLLLFTFGHLQEGNTVLCHMAAGGVGHAVGQLCKTVPNVKLYGTCSTSKHEDAKAAGYKQLIDYKKSDYVKELLLLEPNGVDLVLDPLGGADSKKCYRLTKPFGKQIVYGVANAITGERRNVLRLAKTWASNAAAGKDPLALMNGNKMIGGVHLGTIMTEYYKDFAPKAVADILRWYNDGIIKPKIDSVHALEDFSDAFLRIHDRKNVGKVL
ncbi:uncharacterized protein TRIADDRAFT_13142, partial [Trichoplax adhaerens]